jgi:predicted TIM-barrel fold metal-dependent hydrolase
VPEATISEIRARLKHPIVDCDGHWREWQPILLEYMREVAGPTITDAYLKSRERRGARDRWHANTPEDRLNKRIRRDVGWANPTGNVVDYATTKLPGLMRDRLDELGIDFSILYPTYGFAMIGIRDEEMRRAAIRSFNTMTADIFRPYRDRFAPVAFIPRMSVGEAIDETRYAVQTLGLKAIIIHGALMRPLADGRGSYVDTLGLDTQENWDPFWQTCVDLGVAVTSHSGSLSWPDHASVTNFCFNHIGHFAQANHAFAKAVFLGGIPRRFPTLNFAFLEGGAGWARNLYLDLIGHWEKRNIPTMEQYLRPDLLDINAYADLIQRYGNDRMQRIGTDEVMSNFRAEDLSSLKDITDRERPYLDDFKALDISSKKELAELFSRNFYFGCEADDRTTAWAFDERFGARLKPVFSSDLSHWDALIMADTVPEAYELLEDGLVTENDFRDFTFANAVRLHGGMNPIFFKGTTVESAAAEEIGVAQVAVVVP